MSARRACIYFSLFPFLFSLKSELARWTQVIKQAGITVDTVR